MAPFLLIALTFCRTVICGEFIYTYRGGEVKRIICQNALASTFLGCLVHHHHEMAKNVRLITSLYVK